MTTPEDSPEDTKKITVRPRQMEPRLAPSTPVTEPRPVFEEIPVPSEPSTPRKISRKRPSPALRPDDSTEWPGERNSDSASASPSASADAQESTAAPPVRSTRGKRQKGALGTPVPLGVALAFAIVLTVFAGFFFYSAGNRAGFAEAESAAIKEDVDLSNDFLDRLDAALLELQAGNGTTALAALAALQKEEPEVAALSLLMANAALLANNPSEAEANLSESIRKRESVSNALTLRAIVEAKLATDSEYKKMGSPKVRIEQILQQAIAADASNARPYFELATLKRFEQKYDEAVDLLRSAQCRISAADSRLVTDTALEMTLLQRLPDADLKPVNNPRPVATEIVPAAYIAMRTGDFPRAAELLASAREILPAPLLRQILKDPAFLPFVKEPALQGFFQSETPSSKK